MKKRLIYKILLYSLVFTLFSIGFSSWSIAQDISVFGNITAENYSTMNVVKNTKVQSFEICGEGLINDQTIVNECSAIFTFSVENKYINKDTIDYQLTLTIGNINSSIENYCKNDFILVDNKDVYTKINPFPLYDSTLKQQIYRQDIIVNKDVDVNETEFTIAFVFNNNFYNILNNNLTLRIVLIGK